MTEVTPPSLGGFAVDKERLAHDRDVLGNVEDPFVRRSLGVALHVRRYLPFYVFTLVWALMLALFPTVSSQFRDDGDEAASGRVRAGAESEFDAGTGDIVSTDPSADGEQADGGSTAAANSGRRSSGPRRVSAATIKQSTEIGRKAEGKTRAGFDCKPGVRQFPITVYAAQCTAAWSGDNGGATYDGVHPDKIVIVDRNFPESANSRALEEVGRQAGLADEETAERVKAVFVEYFDKVYETYGRKVEWVDYESENGDSTEEALGHGREGACRDAVKIKKELGAFAVEESSGVFGECGAQLGLITFGSGAYFPESWYRKFHPFVWNGVMECERIAVQVAEYMGKRLINRPAAFAGDPLLQRTKRYFGTYIPENDEYQHCIKITRQKLKEDWGIEDPGPQYNYPLDVSRWPDHAAQAIVQFKAAGVTTISLACDPVSPIFLTQSATQQQYRPEWFTIGTALIDADNAARLYDQTQVDGHLFGMSQLGATNKILGPQSEPGQVYKMITGEDIPEGTTGDYFGLLRIYNMIQAAGPILTPETIDAGAHAMIPGGAPDYPVGYTSFADGPDGTKGAGDHTAIDDSREIYWVCKWNGGRCTEPAPDGRTGTYHETHGGKRWRNGEWPRLAPNEQPPFWPEG